MSHEPPVPKDSIPPYPHHPAPDTFSAAPAEEGSERPQAGKPVIKGAAVGIGSAAIVAALLYMRRR